jgi:hypothetical protein
MAGTWRGHDGDMAETWRGGQTASDRGMLSWSYDSVVPCYRLGRGEREVLRSSDKRCVVITDPEVRA